MRKNLIILFLLVGSSILFSYTFVLNNTVVHPEARIARVKYLQTGEVVDILLKDNKNVVLDLIFWIFLFSLYSLTGNFVGVLFKNLSVSKRFMISMGISILFFGIFILIYYLLDKYSQYFGLINYLFPLSIYVLFTFLCGLPISKFNIKKPERLIYLSIVIYLVLSMVNFLTRVEVLNVTMGAP